MHATWLEHLVLMVVILIPHRITRIAHFYLRDSVKHKQLVTNMHKCNLPVSMLDAKQAKEACNMHRVMDKLNMPKGHSLKPFLAPHSYPKPNLTSWLYGDLQPAVCLSRMRWKF